MHSCPKCNNPISPTNFDPRNDAHTTYCPHCDAKLYNNQQEEAKANIHFFIFIAGAFLLTFYVGTYLITTMGDDITLVAIPPILLGLLYISYRIFSIELDHVHLIAEEEKRSRP